MKLEFSNVAEISGGESELILAGVNESYEYKDNKRTTTKLGTSYKAIMPLKQYEPINVLVKGSAPAVTQNELDAAVAAGSPLKASFTGFSARAYATSNGKLAVSATADGINIIRDTTDATFTSYTSKSIESLIED